MNDVAAPLAAALAKRDDVVFAYLFGSRARGETHARADVDVAVWLREPYDRASFDQTLDVLGTATGALGRDDVDLVVLNEAPLELAFEILKGKLLLSKDDDARIVAEARIMSRYHDRLYYLRRSLAAAQARIRERGFS